MKSYWKPESDVNLVMLWRNREILYFSLNLEFFFFNCISNEHGFVANGKCVNYEGNNKTVKKLINIKRSYKIIEKRSVTFYQFLQIVVSNVFGFGFLRNFTIFVLPDFPFFVIFLGNFTNFAPCLYNFGALLYFYVISRYLFHFQVISQILFHFCVIERTFFQFKVIIIMWYNVIFRILLALRLVIVSARFQKNVIFVKFFILLSIFFIFVQFYWFSYNFVIFKGFAQFLDNVVFGTFLCNFLMFLMNFYDF